MSDLDDLLTRIPISDIAKKLGVDDATARSAVEQAVPALLTGLKHQTTDENSAQGLANALAQHPADLAEGVIKLADVDTADGGKIVNKIFGRKPTTSRRRSPARTRLRPSTRVWSRSCSRCSPRSCSAT